jgi:uncharacterized protein
VKIVWDEPKRAENLRKHGVDFADIDEAFFASAKAGAAKQGRYFAAGWLNGQPRIVFFARLGSEGLSIVSARTPYRKERKLLE